MFPQIGRSHSRPAHPDVGSSWEESDTTNESLGDDDNSPPPAGDVPPLEVEGAAAAAPASAMKDVMKKAASAAPALAMKKIMRKPRTKISKLKFGPSTAMKIIGGPSTAMKKDEETSIGGAIGGPIDGHEEDQGNEVPEWLQVMRQEIIDHERDEERRRCAQVFGESLR